MTIDEVKKQLTEVLQNPEGIDGLVEGLTADYAALDAATAKIAEQEAELAKNNVTIAKLAASHVSTKPVAEVKEEPEKTPQEVFNELFDERFGLNKEVKDGSK